jgi:hypothetical protein
MAVTVDVQDDVNPVMFIGQHRQYVTDRDVRIYVLIWA